MVRENHIPALFLDLLLCTNLRHDRNSNFLIELNGRNKMQYDMTVSVVSVWHILLLSQRSRFHSRL